MKKSLTSLSFLQLEALVKECGQPAYRAGQLFDWLHKKQVASMDEMQNLPGAFRAQLAENYQLDTLQVALCQKSKDGTQKYLLRLKDDNYVEAVLMEYKYGYSLCISSQVGCRMGCRFCASTQNGLVRNLTAGEMLAQVYVVQKDSGKTVSRIVMMGIGEPLDNFEQVTHFIQLVCDERGQNLAGRNLSVSTCGLVPQIEKLAEMELPLTLSISLHAADDETRRTMMPVANTYSVAQLLAACKLYQKKTKRRISYEYAVVPGVNDKTGDATRLFKLLRNMGGHVNLIAVNHVKGSPYTGDSQTAAQKFQKMLCAKGLNATVRRSLGTDIGAACGQLRAEQAQKEIDIR